MDYQEKIELARNLNTPISVLEKLSKDEGWHVRRRIAYNPNTSFSILKTLVFDKDVDVWHEVPHIKKLTRKIEK